jgi:Rrf2 family protein
VRTLVDRKDHLILSFFRAQGMVAGRRCSSTRIVVVKLQTATRLGLYAVLELARDSERTLSAADLAVSFGVSGHHMAKVLGTLSAAGLVRGGRGASGGYRFIGNRRRTTLMDIVALFEQPRASAPGARRGNGDRCRPATRAAGNRRDRRGHLELDQLGDHAQEQVMQMMLLVPRFLVRRLRRRWRSPSRCSRPRRARRPRRATPRPRRRAPTSSTTPPSNGRARPSGSRPIARMSRVRPIACG